MPADLSTIRVPIYLSLPQLAKRWGITADALRQLPRERLPRYWLIGNRRWFRLEDVQAWERVRLLARWVV